jgi:hypothetical protein
VNGKTNGHKFPITVLLLHKLKSKCLEFKDIPAVLQSSGQRKYINNKSLSYEDGLLHVPIGVSHQNCRETSHYGLKKAFEPLIREYVVFFHRCAEPTNRQTVTAKPNFALAIYVAVMFFIIKSHPTLFTEAADDNANLNPPAPDVIYHNTSAEDWYRAYSVLRYALLSIKKDKDVPRAVKPARPSPTTGFSDHGTIPLINMPNY